MSDTLTWTAPVGQSYTGGSALNTFNALATLIAADPNWEVNASDTAAAWIELKPSAGPYVDDRVLLVGGYTLSASMMLTGAASTTDYCAILCAHDDGGLGPDVANIATATGPYAGRHTKYVSCQSFSAGADNVVISTSRDGIVIAFVESGSGDTNIAVAGRLLQTPSGADYCMVSGSGVSTPGLVSSWAGYLASSSQQLFTTDEAFLTTDHARTGYTDGTTTGMNLWRCSGVNYPTGAAAPTANSLGGLAFCPIILAGATSRELVGVARQLKIGGKRLAGFGAILVGATVYAYGIGANSISAEDTLWMTQAQ